MKKRLILLLGIASLLTISCGNRTEMERSYIEREINKYNEDLPTVIGDVLEMSKISYNKNENTVTYVYRFLVDVDADELQTKEELLDNVRGDQSVRDMLTYVAYVNFVFKDVNGNTIKTSQISRLDL